MPTEIIEREQCAYCGCDLLTAEDIDAQACSDCLAQPLGIPILAGLTVAELIEAMTEDSKKAKAAYAEAQQNMLIPAFVLESRRKAVDRLSTALMLVHDYVGRHNARLAYEPLGYVLTDQGREACQEAIFETPLLPCGCYADACHCGKYPTDDEEVPAPSAIGSASCVKCRIANMWGPPSCFGDDCPNPIKEPGLADRLAESIKDDRRAG